MKKGDIKAGGYYETNSGSIVKCDDVGEGRFPRIPKFTVVHPFPGQVRIMEPRELRRTLTDREVQAYAKAS